MRWPPYVVSMRVVEGERTKFRFWFPVFILWPLLAVFLLLTFIATLFADGASMATGHKPGYTRLLVGVLGVVGESRGTEVFVQDKNHKSRTVAFTVR